MSSVDPSSTTITSWRGCRRLSSDSTAGTMPAASLYAGTMRLTPGTIGEAAAASRSTQVRRRTWAPKSYAAASMSTR